MLKWTAVMMGLGFILDLILGDPVWLYHPVRIIGNLISFLEKHIRKILPNTERGEHIGGFITVVLILAFCFGLSFAILKIAFGINTVLGVAIGTFMCYQMLSVRSLQTEALKVYRELEKDDIEASRKAVSMIVGRDTDVLDKKGVTKAVVETVAENLADGIIGPMFYMAIGGPVLMWVYKGINTMDSMLGYKNDRFINFGRYAAKLDDIANFIPSRLCGVLMILCSGIAGFDRKNAKKIFKRDRFNHASPNSAQTESVMAGALNIQLAGDAVYFGKVLKKKTIGDDNREIEIDDIKRANRLLVVTSSLMTLICVIINAAIALI